MGESKQPAYRLFCTQDGEDKKSKETQLIGRFFAKAQKTEDDNLEQFTTLKQAIKN